MLNLIRAILGIHHRRFNLFVKRSSAHSLYFPQQPLFSQLTELFGGKVLQAHFGFREMAIVRTIRPKF
jgi:hypothetical protein